jgi:hypothetical protein
MRAVRRRIMAVVLMVLGVAGCTADPGWTVTVYYTAVERFHAGATTAVTGCLKLDCAHGRDSLGTYPASFVQAVQDEGTGRTNDGRYLNWSEDVGYWLDVAPRDSHGQALRPFESAAADADVLAAGTRFTITACGQDEDGSAVPQEVCRRLRESHWVITDEFTTGLGGSRHIDVYIGEETGPGFTDGPWYVTLVNADLRIG